MISTVTSKGQITIPVEVRRAAGLEAGAQVEFIVNTRQRIELVPRQGDIRALRGTVPVPAAAVDVDAMNVAAAQTWAVGSARPAAERREALSAYRVQLAPPSPPDKT